MDAATNSVASCGQPSGQASRDQRLREVITERGCDCVRGDRIGVAPRLKPFGARGGLHPGVEPRKQLVERADPPVSD